MSIIETLQLIQSKLNAPKNQYNSFGKYSYRNCEDILEALKRILAEHKASVVISDEVVQKGDRFYVRATATLYCGEDSISASAEAREPEGRKGMDEAQVTGATSSYARKYALNGLFAIDDDKDPDANDNRSDNQSDRASKQEVEEIENIAEQVGVSISKLEKKYGVKVLNAMTKKQAEECITGLRGMLANESI